MCVCVRERERERERQREFCVCSPFCGILYAHAPQAISKQIIKFCSNTTAQVGSKFNNIKQKAKYQGGKNFICIYRFNSYRAVNALCLGYTFMSQCRTGKQLLFVLRTIQKRDSTLHGQKVPVEFMNAMSVDT